VPCESLHVVWRRKRLKTVQSLIFRVSIYTFFIWLQAEWKCVATSEFGHSVTSCYLKLLIPRHYKKPRFLENLRAILSEEGAVNLECKVSVFAIFFLFCFVLTCFFRKRKPFLHLLIRAQSQLDCHNISKIDRKMNLFVHR